VAASNVNAIDPFALQLKICRRLWLRLGIEIIAS
jgi:hypothetical protein